MPNPEPFQPGVNLEAIQLSPLIYGDTDFTKIEEKDFDETKISWLGTNIGQVDTPQEQLENKLAIQEQVKMGIIDDMGMPIGFTFDELGIPKDQHENLRNIKAQRAAQQGQQHAPQQVPPVIKNQQILNPSLVEENRRFQQAQQAHFNTIQKTPSSNFAKRMLRQNTRETEKEMKLRLANEKIRKHQEK